MKTAIYLYRTALKNRIKKALKKPTTYLYVIFIIGYLFMVFGSFGTTLEKMHLNTPDGLVMMLSLFMLTIVPANFITFSKKKGLLFTQSDIHFMFQAPVSPKVILLYAYFRNIIMDFVVQCAMIPIGVFYFGISLWRMLAYFAVSFVLENAVQMAIMVILYGNESLSEKSLKAFCWLIRVILLFFVVYAGIKLLGSKPSVGFFEDYVRDPIVQIVPIVGWNVALIQLVFLGPTTVNVIVAVLYFISAAVIITYACRMKCSGKYYEDAMKFADDYAEARAKSQKGQIAVVGKKSKYQKASVDYKGTGAKAIYYKQLLEYKKTKFFIFGFYHLLCLAAGILCAVMAVGGQIFEEKYGIFILPGVCAYLSFLSSGLAPKWQKELENPYTYLIPDTNMNKLWYATKIEHIRSAVSGALIVLPSFVVARFNIGIALLAVISMVCLEANKVYSVLVCDTMFHGGLGNFGKQMLKLIIQGIVITFGVAGAFLGTWLVNVAFGFVMMTVALVVTAFSMMLIGMTLFNKMEGNVA